MQWCYKCAALRGDKKAPLGKTHGLQKAEQTEVLPQRAATFPSGGVLMLALELREAPPVCEEVADIWGCLP